MRLDPRIDVGSEVIVRRQQRAEVVAISDDGLSCQVKPKGSPEDFEPVTVSWNEVKLPDDHL